MPKAYFEALEAVPGKAVRFLGYETEVHDASRVLAIIVDNALVNEAAVGATVEVVLDVGDREIAVMNVHLTDFPYQPY